MLDLVGWRFDLSFLTGVVPGMATMKPNTALCLAFLAGAGISFSTPANAGRRRAARILCALVLLVTGSTLVETSTGIDFGIDTLLLVALTGRPAPALAGRMADGTAIACIALATAILLVGRPRLASQAAAIGGVGGAIGLLAIISYPLDVQALEGIKAFASISLPTAISLVLLAAIVPMLAPGSGPMAVITSPAMGGKVVRAVLPLALLGPILLTWVVDQAVKHGWHASALAIAVVALGYVLASIT